MKQSSHVHKVFLSALLVSVSLPAMAQSNTVLMESEGVQITFTDLEVELSKAPPDVRNSLMFRKEGLAQLATNLLIRRVLAKQYEKAGPMQNATTKAALQLARDRTLSDLQLQRLDALNQPSLQAIERRALEIYRAEASRFEVPEEVQASHILILAGTENAETKAKLVLEELKSGGNFADLASKHSQDPGSAAKGGELGFFGKGRMVKEFEASAFSLKKGEISDLVQSQFGYHIIKVTDRREAGKKSFESVKEQLMTEALQKLGIESRLQISDQIIGTSKAFPEQLDAFIASQAKK